MADKHRSVTDPEEAARLLAQGTADENAGEDLPPASVIALDVTGTRGKRYVGKFFYTVPTLGEQVKIGNLKSMMLPQGAAADMNAATLVDVLCYLQITIKWTDECPRPSWWDPANARDATPYTALFGRCLDYEARFHGKRSNARADEGEPQVEEEPDRGREAPVGRKVPPPSQRRETLAGDGS